MWEQAPRLACLPVARTPSLGVARISPGSGNRAGSLWSGVCLGEHSMPQTSNSETLSIPPEITLDIGCSHICFILSYSCAHLSLIPAGSFLIAGKLRLHKINSSLSPSPWFSHRHLTLGCLPLGMGFISPTLSLIVKKQFLENPKKDFMIH